MNVIYLRYKGRETGFPPAGARRNYVSTRPLSSSIPSRLLKEEAKAAETRVVVKGGTALR